MAATAERARLARLVLNSVQDPTAVIDGTGAITSVNAAWTSSAGPLLATAVGADYLACCREAAAAGKSWAGAVEQAVGAVLRRELRFSDVELRPAGGRRGPISELYRSALATVLLLPRR